VAVLHIVSTPIGNLGDMTRRAVEVLATADIVLAEDTRRTATLLRHYEIQRKLVSAHEHNEASRAESVVRWLDEGLSVALVTDAGTPLLSDPGSRIVRKAVAAGHEVVPIPGASALLAALVGSGLPADRFTFYGFIPRKGGARAALLEEIARTPHTVVLYESPQRLGSLLADLAPAAGSERRAAVAREITKLHEEFVRGTLGELADRYADAPPLGEIVVVMDGRTAAPDPEAAAEVARGLARELLADGVSPTSVVRRLREELGIPRNQAYQLVHEVAGS
jgi:16S rRNA (cytidine1402-2'-O)-methyltransferase